MNISYNWLKDLVEINMPAAELAQKLTDAGLAVEGVHEAGDDFVFDIDLTSNRGDCLSHRGVARETAVITGTDLKPAETLGDQPAATDQRLVTIDDPDLCHRFTARVIRNVRIGPSPEWLVKRLEAVGERSINNVADITNYVMHELGQPMHSFDFNKLKENRIVVRRARAGEKIKTLDEVERSLDETMLAICDAEKPVAVGGVMGGFDSGITEATTDVLLEVAYFKRESIRQTSRLLKLSTEASHRFERGVDIENLVRASNRATRLICELAGGTAGEFVDVYPTEYRRIEIESKDIQSAVKRLTGLDVRYEEISRILTALGIDSKIGPEGRRFTVPTWRHDLAIETDLVEEIARIVGYDRIGEELPPAVGAGEYQPNELRKFHLRQSMADLGFDEALSYSFIDTRHDETFALVPGLLHEHLDEKFVTLKDSIIEGAVRMRPSLLPGLLDAVRTNFNYQNRNLRLFELGKVFSASEKENELPDERELFALVMTGGETLEQKAMTGREFDFFDAKGALENAIHATNAPALEYAAADVRHLRKGQAAEIRLDGRTVGTLGRLSDEVAQGYKFRQPVFVAEIDLETILAHREQTAVYRPLPVYPSVERDVSLLVKRTVSFEAIKKSIGGLGFELLKKVEFVDVYEGKGVPDDERSLTLRLVYRSDERTLVEAEVEPVHTAILRNLEEIFDAKQRF
ncbi:MAG: phenylalanine--tRNA ligase subunit beta [Acidobacteria bacterium]|nr:phenylalanine--tRNA ligase subunit beta [Acidobacteriota bacterium]